MSRACTTGGGHGGRRGEHARRRNHKVGGGKRECPKGWRLTLGHARRSTEAGKVEGAGNSARTTTATSGNVGREPTDLLAPGPPSTQASAEKLEGGPAVLLLASTCSGRRRLTAGRGADSGDSSGNRLG